MTLDQCYTTYQGTAVLVDGNPADAGQCVQWADVVLAHVYGFVTHYGNAIDWWNDPGDLLTDGFKKVTDGSIKKGDFVVYDSRVGSVFGHIDVAMADGSRSNYLGADSNWGHNLTVHEVQHNDNYNNYILGSLRLKGGNMTDSLTKEEIAGIYQLAFDNDDYPQDLINAYTGKPLDGLVTQLLSDPSYKQHKIQVNNPSGATQLKPGLYEVN